MTTVALDFDGAAYPLACHGSATHCWHYRENPELEYVCCWCGFVAREITRTLHGPYFSEFYLLYGAEEPSP